MALGRPPMNSQLVTAQPAVISPTDDDFEIDFDAIDAKVAAGRSSGTAAQSESEIELVDVPAPRRRDTWGHEARQKFPDFKESLSIVKVWPNPGICEVPGCGGPATIREHCHETGNFRGWTCGKCNHSLGNLGDSLNNIQNGIVTYLRRAQQKVREAIGAGLKLEGNMTSETSEVLAAVLKAVDELANLKKSVAPDLHIEQFVPDLTRIILAKYYEAVPSVPRVPLAVLTDQAAAAWGSGGGSNGAVA
jgi:Recombination endonuclease VII